jgi:RimJ/RimL family protein N-acetyltransferase
MFYGPKDEADTRDYIQRMLDSQVERPRLIWELAIVRRADSRLIGACDLTLENKDEADLGYILARDVWGQGYATEATREMVCAGFEQLNLKRIFAMCEVNNISSARVLEKAGLHRRTILPNYKEAKGRWWDMYLYAITSSEWREGFVRRSVK